MRRLLILLLLIGARQEIAAQSVSQRGFVEATGTSFPQDAPNDSVNVVGAVLIRDEIFIRPAPWLQLAAGADVRADTHDQVDDTVRLDFFDREPLRPLVSIRRLALSLTGGRFTVDAGKQVIRWGKTDIITPTDWFAPRDFLNVIDNEVLPVTSARGLVRFGAGALEAVWVPALTPSRLPLTTQRWTVAPPGTSVTMVDDDSGFPGGAQGGIRWTYAGSRVEYSLAFFDGYHHLPNFAVGPPATSGEITLTPRYPAVRSYGGDLVLPLRWLTVKGEGAYFTSDTDRTDEYVLYVVQVERQIGEWALLGGYTGEHVTKAEAQLTFAPDRGVAPAIVGRAAYTLDVNRGVAFEGAVRQDADGAYLKAEYTQAFGRRWRTTVYGSLIRGEPDDFIGQYRRNSSVTLSLRYSF